jgi:hypothetical protein
MFDSPMEHCQVCGQMIALDQSKPECGRRNGCATDTVCPLQKYFAGIDCSAGQPKENLRDKEQ